MRFERQRGRMRKRSLENRIGSKRNVRKKATPAKILGRLASRRKRWVRRIWLDTVLAGERERLNLQIHQGMLQRKFKSTTTSGSEFVCINKFPPTQAEI